MPDKLNFFGKVAKARRRINIGYLTSGICQEYLFFMLYVFPIAFTGVCGVLHCMKHYDFGQKNVKAVSCVNKLRELDIWLKLCVTCAEREFSPIKLMKSSLVRVLPLRCLLSSI